MAEKTETLTTEMVEPAAKTATVQEPKVVEQEPTPAEHEGDEFDKERAMATINKLRAIEKDAQKEHKELEQLRAAEKKREEEALSELERYQKRAEEAEKEATELRLSVLRRKVADEVGLPGALADRLQGADEESLKADAERLLEAIPPSTIQKPKIKPTNPADADKVETIEQKRARLLGRKVSPFDEGLAKDKGGGVFSPPEE